MDFLIYFVMLLKKKMPNRFKVIDTCMYIVVQSCAVTRVMVTDDDDDFSVQNFYKDKKSYIFLHCHKYRWNKY